MQFWDGVGDDTRGIGKLLSLFGARSSSYSRYYTILSNPHEKTF